MIFVQFKGDTPSACWNKIYNRIKKIQSASDSPDVLGKGLHESGTDMFGFSNPEVDKLIQVFFFLDLKLFVVVLVLSHFAPSFTGLSGVFTRFSVVLISGP